MADYLRKRMEMELRAFTSKHFEKPSSCRDLEQTRFYIAELVCKVKEMECACNVAPAWAYALLAQYNARLNSLLLADFKKAYH